MSRNSPLGENYGWVTTKDHRYSPRDTTQAVHDAMVIELLKDEPDVLDIETSLDHKVVLAVRLGMHTIHMRVYNRRQVETKPDNLASRLAEPDPATFLIFNDSGTLELLEGERRWAAQGHSPELYADRRLAPIRKIKLDMLQHQFTQVVLDSSDAPTPSAPLVGEEWDDKPFHLEPLSTT